MAEAKIVLAATDNTSGAFASAQRNLQQLTRTAASAINPISNVGTVLAASLSGAGIVAAIRSGAEYADGMGKLAQRAGTTSEAISGLAYAARLADVDQQLLAKGLRAIAKDAGDGGAKLSAMGVALKDANGNAKTSDQLFTELAGRFATMPDGIGKTNALIDLFGEKVGPNLAPLLNAGSAGIQQMTAEAAKFGLVVSEDAAKAAETFNDNLTRLQARGEGFVQQMGGQVLPTLVNITEELLAADKAGSGVGDTLAQKVGGGIRTVTETLAVLAADVTFVFKGMGREIGGIAAQLVALARLDFKGFSAISDAMKEDAVRARAELDRYQQSILLGLRDTAGAGRGSATGDPRLLASLKTGGVDNPLGGVVRSTAKVKDPFADELLRLNKDLAKTQADNVAKQLGLNDAYKDFITLANSPLWATFTDGQKAQLAAVAAARIEVEAKTAAERQSIEAQKELGQTLARTTALDQQLHQQELARVDSMAQANQQLRDEIAAIGLTEEALAKLNVERADAAIKQAELNLIDARSIEGNEEKVGLLERELNLLRQRRELITEQGARQVAVKQEALSKGFSDELHSDVKGALMRAFEDTKNPAQSFATALASTLYSRVAGALANSIADGFVGPMQEALRSIKAPAGSGAGGGNFLAQIFGMFSGSGGLSTAGGGNGAFMADLAAMGVFSGGGYTGPGGKYEPAGIVHKGEFVLSKAATQRIGVPALNQLNGYAMGGLVGGKGPLAKAGQGGGNVDVVVNNHSGQPASARETTDSRGNRRIEVTVGEIVAAELRRPGSAAHGAMRGTFGSAPALVGR